MHWRDFDGPPLRTIELSDGPEVVVNPSPSQLASLRRIGPLHGLLHPPTGQVFVWLAECMAPHVMEPKLFVAGHEPRGGAPPSWWRNRHPDDSVYVLLDLREGVKPALTEAAKHPAVRCFV